MLCVQKLAIFRPDGAVLAMGVLGWHTFQSMSGSFVIYPPFEGGGVFALFAKMMEDDPNTGIPDIYSSPHPMQCDTPNRACHSHESGNPPHNPPQQKTGCPLLPRRCYVPPLVTIFSM